MPKSPALAAAKPLRVLHILRAPLGGLFRHVCDLAEGQNRAGLEVGVVVGDEPRDLVSAARLRALSAVCALGVRQLPMNRLPGIGDATNLLRIGARAGLLQADIIHGHGAKGGAYARLLPYSVGGFRVYTPHGGSLHYDPASLQGKIFFAAERFMRRRTDGFIFESDFGLRTFLAKIGEPRAPSIVVHNGVAASEFARVERVADPADFVFVGELRLLKGVGTLIEAIATVGTPVRLCVVGSGPDRATFEEMARQVPAHVRIEFMGAMPAREAFALGRVVVMPSHHESLPYVALEAAAAGVPLIATRVGGVPEIFGADASRLVSPASASALARALVAAIADREDMTLAAVRLRLRVEREFSATHMVEGVVGFYRSLLEPSSAQRRARGGKPSLTHFHEGIPS